MQRDILGFLTGDFARVFESGMEKKKGSFAKMVRFGLKGDGKRERRLAAIALLTR